MGRNAAVADDSSARIHASEYTQGVGCVQQVGRQEEQN
jgi:hypothetical protein